MYAARAGYLRSAPWWQPPGWQAVPAAHDAGQALALLRKGRPAVVLGPDSVAALSQFVGRRQAAAQSSGGAG
ncbi:hypothetical protein ACU4HD_42900 [Cupriavidus basilensis]